MNTDLRERMARELDHLDPMPDLVPRTVRQGGRVRRRRQLATGSVLGLAAIAGGGFVVRLAGEGPAVVPPPATSPTATPEPAEGTSRVALWEGRARTALKAALPPRFSDLEGGGILVDYAPDGVTAGGYAEQPNRHGVLIRVRLRSGAPATGLAAVGDGWTAAVQRGVGTSGDEAVTLDVVHGDVWAHVTLRPAGPDGEVVTEVPLDSAEALDIARAPEFRHLVEQVARDLGLSG